MPGKRKKYSRAYVEITNICNLTCSFCPGTIRAKNHISLAAFSAIIAQVKPLTDQVFLHVMGEPLLHPQFEEIIAECQINSLPVEIVTNGTQFGSPNAQVLFHPIIRQVNISFHALQNDPIKNKQFIEEIIAFTHQAIKRRPDLYINYRFWSLRQPGDSALLEELDWLVTILQKEFGLHHLAIPTNRNKSINIENRLYLHFDTRFEWPDIKTNTEPKQNGRCLALSQQFAVLTDGTVLPCCLDRNGTINLGNCLAESLETILDGDRAKQIIAGFQKGKLVEPLCQHCSYCSRFNPVAQNH